MKVTSAFSFCFAAPELIDCTANGIASDIVSAFPEATIAAAAFNNTMSRRAESAPSSNSRMRFELVCASPPEISVSGARRKPNSSGVTV